VYILFEKLRKYKDASYELEKDLKELIHILSNGTILPNANYRWLEEYKASFSNDVIDVLLSCNQKIVDDNKADLKIKLADVILIHDKLNEEAVLIKCRTYNKMDKHSLSKKIFDEFTKTYQKEHGEEFEQGFDFFISEE
ncbi:MAG: hypothetical protein AB8B61_07740, partial [Cyclobacteriaceae bacterium]